MKRCTATLFLAALIGVFLAAPACGQTDDEALIGRWDQSGADGFLRLCNDGTFRWGTPRIGTLEGDYRLLTGSAIEFTVLSPCGQRRTAEFKYALKGNALWLKAGKRWVIYKKAK